MVQPRETYVDGQHHPQQELVDGHHARNAVNGQSFFNQFLEAQLLQHGRYGEQTTIGRKILGTEVKRRGSRNFIGLRTICRKALFGTGFLDMLLFVLHHLGDPLEVEFVKPASFANSFLPHVFGVPKWFLQIRALPKPTPVHYSGYRIALRKLSSLSRRADRSAPHCKPSVAKSLLPTFVPSAQEPRGQRLNRSQRSFKTL